MASVMLMPNKADKKEEVILKHITDAWNATEGGCFYAAELLCRVVYYHGTENLHRKSAGGNRSENIESMILMHLKEMYPTLGTTTLKYVLYFNLWLGRVEVEHNIMEPAFVRFKDTLWKPTNIFNCKGLPDMRTALFTAPHPLGREFRDTWKEFRQVCPNAREYVRCITGIGYYTLHNYMTGIQTPKSGVFEKAIASMQAEIRRRKGE